MTSWTQRDERRDAELHVPEPVGDPERGSPASRTRISVSAWPMRSEDTTGPTVVSDALLGDGPELASSADAYRRACPASAACRLRRAGRRRRRGARAALARLGWRRAGGGPSSAGLAERPGLTRTARGSRRPALAERRRTPTAPGADGAGRRRRRRPAAGAERVGADLDEAVAAPVTWPARPCALNTSWTCSAVTGRPRSGSPRRCRRCSRSRTGGPPCRP